MPIDQAEEATQPQDFPQEAELILHGGGRIECTIVGDHHRDLDGSRRVWLQPVRALIAGERVQGISLDVWPPRATVEIYWPVRGHHGVYHDPAPPDWSGMLGPTGGGQMDQQWTDAPYRG